MRRPRQDEEEEENEEEARSNPLFFSPARLIFLFQVHGWYNGVPDRLSTSAGATEEKRERAYESRLENIAPFPLSTVRRSLVRSSSSIHTYRHTACAGRLGRKRREEDENPSVGMKENETRL